MSFVVCTTHSHKGGTLYHASNLINRVLHKSASINITGQNGDSIDSWDEDYHPCIPEPMSLDKEIEIIFGSSVTSQADWFPSSCPTDTSSYDNEYVFDGGLQWTISGLVVDGYDASSLWNILRSESERAAVKCNNCSFTNITGSSSNLFQTYASIHFEDSVFSDIDCSDNYMIDAAHYDQVTGEERELTFTDCTFSDIVTSNGLVHLEGSTNDVK